MADKQQHWRTAIWARINNAFSALSIAETALKYKNYQGQPPKVPPNFVDFVVDAGIVPATDEKQWRLGLRNFAPGTFEIVSLAVDMNLGGGKDMYTKIDGGVSLPQGDDPLPMLFVRSFGDKEFVTVQPTPIGIKVTLSSTRDGFDKDATHKGWGDWSTELAKRTLAGSGP